MFQLKRELDVAELWNLLAFVKKGGKIICLPMYAGVPSAEYVKILTASGYTSETVPEQIADIPNVPIGDMDFHTTLSRSYPASSSEKIYDFINCTWADNIKEKRWDLAVDLVENLCVNYSMVLVVYKNVIPESDKKRLIPFIDSGKLVLYESCMDKDKFSDLMRKSRVGIVNSEWDARPRYLDQLLLCDIPVVLNENIYGGQNFIRGGSGEICKPADMAEFAVKILNNLGDYKGIRDRYLENFGVYNSAKVLTCFLNNLLKCNYKIIAPKAGELFFKADYIREYAESIIEKNDWPIISS
ncbi:MAG: hypothetical protein ACYTFY_01530 [Planctomycetota bacterium]